MPGNHTAFKSHKGTSEKPSKNLQVKPAFTFAQRAPLDHMQVFSVAMIYRTSISFLRALMGITLEYIAHSVREIWVQFI